MARKVHVGIEMAMSGDQGVSRKSSSKEKLKKHMNVIGEKARRFPNLLWKVGREDPRRVIHAFKVGLSLTLVSLLYLMGPLFKGIGENAIWAVMTVVVVLEFTAGATFCKGLNRGLGTLLAGSLAFLFEYIANESGHIFRAVFIGSAVFLVGNSIITNSFYKLFLYKLMMWHNFINMILKFVDIHAGAAATYMRFIPYIKKNYDYGVVIFLLTFNLITVSSYRAENVLRIAHDRFYTIAIGCGICLFMSLIIFPNWSGEDLHNSTVAKFEGLAKSIEACVNEYFNDSAEEVKINLMDKPSDDEDPIYKGYKAVLDSKSIDETLVSFFFFLIITLSNKKF